MRISDWSSDVCSSDLPAAEYSYPRHPSEPESNFCRCYHHDLPEQPEPNPLRWEYRRRGNRSWRAVHELPAQRVPAVPRRRPDRSDEHTSDLQSLMRTSYAVFCLTKKTQ